METADLMVLIERYCNPSLNSPVRNSKIGWMGRESGSTCPSAHQLVHLFHAHWYVMFLPLLHPAAKNWEISSEILVTNCLSLTVSRQLTTTGLPLLVGVGCWRGPSTARGPPEGSWESWSAAPVELGTTVVISILVQLTPVMPSPPWPWGTCHLDRMEEKHSWFPCSMEAAEHPFLWSPDLVSNSHIAPAEHWVGKRRDPLYTSQTLPLSVGMPFGAVITLWWLDWPGFLVCYAVVYSR